jgi:putative membrane protein
MPALSIVPVLLAHPGHGGLELGEVMRWWTWEPFEVAGLLVSAVLYASGASRLWRQTGGRRALRPGQAASYGAGLLVLVVALLSPLKALSDILFSAHMTQHELLMVVAAPLLVLGRPLVPTLWALPPDTRERVASWVHARPARIAWRALTGPLAVWAIHGTVLWAWHVPALFEGAMRHDAVHAVQHLSFLVTAAFFWWAVLHGRYGRLGYGAAVLFVFTTGLHSGVLGALLTVSPSLWYPIYAQRGAPWGVSPIDDQQVAGLIMWVPAGAVFLVIGLALFAAWLGESERRQVYASTAEAPPGAEVARAD